MCNYKIAAAAFNLIIFLLPAGLITLSGCATVSKEVTKDSSAPSFPSYRLGTTFVYSDGSWATVRDITPDRVTWQDHRGNVYSGSPDFTYRPADLRTRSRHVSRRFVPRSDFLVNRDTSLWPLKTGKTASFTEMVTSRKNGVPEKSYRRIWTCEVTGTEPVTVIAGEFDTWKITCGRYNNYQNPSKAKVREKRTWYYAPEINHYVLTERQSSAGQADRRLELLAVLPPTDGLPSSARDKMKQTFQKALEFKKSGDTVAWSTAGASWSGKITPTATFKLADGRFGRRFVQTVKSPDDEHTYYGMAVRNSEGIWEIPRRQ